MPQSWMDLTLAPRMVRQVRLQGDGQFAAATRVELRRFGLLREIDYELPELLPPLVIVCSDVEGDQGVAGEALRATADRCPILMACLAVPLIRIGPLVEPPSAAPSTSREWRNVGAGRARRPHRGWLERHCFRAGPENRHLRPSRRPAGGRPGLELPARRPQSMRAEHAGRGESSLNRIKSLSSA
jgi:hypothetical protein